MFASCLVSLPLLCFLWKWKSVTAFTIALRNNPVTDLLWATDRLLPMMVSMFASRLYYRRMCNVLAFDIRLRTLPEWPPMPWSRHVQSARGVAPRPQPKKKGETCRTQAKTKRDVQDGQNTGATSDLLFFPD
jgi:hypothetical protein